MWCRSCTTTHLCKGPCSHSIFGKSMRKLYLQLVAQCFYWLCNATICFGLNWRPTIKAETCCAEVDCKFYTSNIVVRKMCNINLGNGFYCSAIFRPGTHWAVYVPLTGFSRISHRCSHGQDLLHSGTEKKENVAVSSGSSVTAGLVGSVAECLIRVATDVKSQALH